MQDINTEYTELGELKTNADVCVTVGTPFSSRSSSYEYIQLLRFLFFFLLSGQVGFLPPPRTQPMCRTTDARFAGALFNVFEFSSCSSYN